MIHLSEKNIKNHFILVKWIVGLTYILVVQSTAVLAAPNVSNHSPKSYAERIEEDSLIEIRGIVLTSGDLQPVTTKGLVHVQEVGKDIHPYETVTNEQGLFSIKVPNGFKYKIWPSIENYITTKEEFVDLSGKPTSVSVIEKNLFVSPLELGTKVKLSDIYFAYGKAKLTSESTPALDKVVDFMNDYPAVTIEIMGHTDNSGSQEINLRLSQERAESVKNYLLEQGIGSHRVSAKGYGQTYPIADNSTKEGRELNRRVEFKVTKK